MRLLLILAAALVLVVTTSSAMLRLSAGGAGCAPWPACYEERADGAAAAAPDVQSAPAWHRPVRLAHRVTASLSGVLFLLAVLFGWRRWTLGERVAGLLLLAVSAALAVLGRYTPSTLPAVVQANLLGGHLLLAALAWLMVRPRLVHQAVSAPAVGARAAAWALMVLVLGQAALGGMVSARSAAAACQAGGCAYAPAGADGAFDPWRANATFSRSATAPQRQAVLQAHTASGVVTVALALFVAWRARRAMPALAMALSSVAASAVLLGGLMRGYALPLATPVVHGVLAAVLLALAAAVCRQSRART